MKYLRVRSLAISKIVSSFLFAVAFCALVASDAFAVTLHPGDILVADPDFVHGITSSAFDLDLMQPSIARVDPVTGVREIVTSKTIGDGAPLLSATQVVVDKLGRITVADPYSDAL